jgi:RimJ/RimL family protein N-acetyltransferase
MGDAADMTTEINPVSDISLPIRTDRLILRKFGSGDYLSYAAYHSRPDVYRFLYCDPPAGELMRQNFERVVEPRFAEDGDAFHLAVERRNDGAVIGETLFKLASKTALQLEVGYIFNPAFGGQGYATEAVAATVAFGFAELGAHRIFARLDALNSGSAGVVERLGFRREAHLIQNDRFNGSWGDEFIYALLRGEWERQRGRIGLHPAADATR